MTEPIMQDVLNELLANLKSGDVSRQMDGLQKLGAINFSSDAVVKQLEKLALGENEEVRAAALNALKLKTSKLVAQKRAVENKFNRALIVKEIGGWETDGLLEPHRAEVIRRRYDFDSESAQPAARLTPAKAETPAPEPARPAASSAPPPPRPTFAQTFLSEASTKIYLYLGAFLVIIAAAIWAIVRPEARLPVLIVATVAFGAGAIFTRKRLPLPSFVLSIVFSFLLPIDANVIDDSLALSTSGNEIYWTLVFLAMALIWAFGAWFYESRLFTALAYFSLILGALRFGDIFDARENWSIFFISVANLLGLAAMFALKKWKDAKFILPVFLLAQLVQFILVFVSYFLNLGGSVTGADLSADWLPALLTWILAASFYVASDSLVPFPLFPWTAAASLFPLPWTILSAFDASASAQMVGYAVSAALAVAGSEAVLRFGLQSLPTLQPLQNQEILESASAPRFKKYHFPLLALSLPLFTTAIVIGFDRSAQNGFAALLSVAFVYTLVNAARPRWYVWMTALLAAIGAYFTFYQLPGMWEFRIHISYQLIGASLALLTPELFLKGEFSFRRSWSWPPILLGFIAVGLNILLVMSVANYDQTTIVFGVSAALAAAYALRFGEPLLGYFSTTLLALTVVFALQFYERDWWLPALTALAALYYAAGFVLARRAETQPWGAMLIVSALALGGLISALAVIILEPNGGWYALVIAAIFLTEMFVRKNGWLELFAEIMLSAALFHFLTDLEIDKAAYFLFGLSLLWFACDLAFKYAFQGTRKLEYFTKVIASLLTLAGALFVSQELPSGNAALYLGIYTLFFAAYAWVYKNALIGYVPAAFLALTVYFGLDAAGLEMWFFPQIALAVIYYAAGFILRRGGETNGWSATFLFSGFILGTLVAMLCPMQDGGLEKAIPIALAASLYAVEAFARKNVWLGFPANLLYLVSYFTILIELNVDEAQFFSVGAAALGMLMHYLLTRTDNKSAAFITGILSQLVLLSTSYIQMVGSGELKYFFVLFLQSLVVLIYGVVIRSRSLVIAPIAFIALASVTVLYNALKDLSVVLIIGITGLILLGLGTLAVVMRERISNLAEQFSDWDA
ncbi:MAG: hypothetical protein HY867_02830 [Chloroflexi bacterium]|nr:hypothetical protein [Chloroflexota bacterium]